MRRKGRLSPAEKEAIWAARGIFELADEYEPPETCRRGCEEWVSDQYGRGLWDAWDRMVLMMLNAEAFEIGRIPRDNPNLLFVAMRWMRLRGEEQP